jgi:hypothetical protein
MFVVPLSRDFLAKSFGLEYSKVILAYFKYHHHHHHHPNQSGIDRTVSASSNGLLKGLPNRLRPCGLYYFNYLYYYL